MLGENSESELSAAENKITFYFVPGKLYNNSDGRNVYPYHAKEDEI